MGSGHVGQPEEANERRILLGPLSRKSITCKIEGIDGNIKMDLRVLVVRTN
jgi:hypothetical protein